MDGFSNYMLEAEFIDKTLATGTNEDFKEYCHRAIDTIFAYPKVSRQEKQKLFLSLHERAQKLMEPGND